MGIAAPITDRFDPAAWFTYLHRWGRRKAGRDRVGFVLPGGGNLGAIQVGQLAALAEAGIRPDLIVGCSVGAINGAAFASDPTSGGVENLRRIWTRLEVGDPDLMPTPRLMPMVAQMARRGEAIHDSDRLATLLAEELPCDRFEDLAVPFHCVATNVANADEHWFSGGQLIPALLASAALPAVYPPVTIGANTYIDGGVLREVHVQRAIELGATELYVLDVGRLGSRSTEIRRPFDALIQAYWTARTYRFQDDLNQVPDHCTVHRLPAGSKPRLRFDDFSQGARLAELAQDATRYYLSTGRAPTPTVGPESPGPLEDYRELDRRLDDADWAVEPMAPNPPALPRLTERAAKRLSRYRSTVTIGSGKARSVFDPLKRDEESAVASDVQTEPGSDQPADTTIEDLPDESTGPGGESERLDGKATAGEPLTSDKDCDSTVNRIQPHPTDS